MSLTQRLKLLVPLLILFTLLGLLGRELFYAKSNELPSALIGEPLPAFQLENLILPNVMFSPQALQGKVSLLNVWATWCYACSIEHPMLMKIKNQYHVPLYSINYKDDPQEARAWLTQHGNPYIQIGRDIHGDTAIDLGVYGTPETFVINQAGKIVYRHIGAINQQNWDTVLYPLIKKLEQDNA